MAFEEQDVIEPEGWPRVLDAAIVRCGRLDVLVNNAGIAIISDAEALSFENWRRTLAVNLDAVFLSTQAVIARTKNTGGGSIINLDSIEGLIGDPLVPAYNASKGGVRLFTRSVAIDCARRGYGIRVNCVCPGFGFMQREAATIGEICHPVVGSMAGLSPSDSIFFGVDGA